MCDKSSDLSDEQLFNLFESVPTHEEVSSISNDDENDGFLVVEALTPVSFVGRNAEEGQNIAHEHGPIRKNLKGHQSPLPAIEHLHQLLR